jgi:hypothetical protein
MNSQIARMAAEVGAVDGGAYAATPKAPIAESDGIVRYDDQAQIAARAKRQISKPKKAPLLPTEHNLGIWSVPPKSGTG